MEQKKTLLLIVDPQNDFCDPKGVLYIPGANNDMRTLAHMIQENREKIDSIELTLDSHHWIHIAHPYFWANENGDSPPPFTIIHQEDVLGPNPRWKARFPRYLNYAIDYVQKLNAQKKYELTIWPPHCIMGTWGHNIYPPLIDALHYYEETFSKVHYNFKGSNPLTEHYSGIKAEIIDPTDPSTDINKYFLDRITSADQVIIAGEALSHCVANTVYDIFKYLGTKQASKTIILEDVCSNIPGFEDFGRQFLNEMRALNVKVAKSTNCFN
jgi:nicotinamidase/pyrazinamidase